MMWTAMNIREQAAEWAERTAVEQGLPPRVDDIAVLRHVLYLLGITDAAREPD
jgi:hypothetical protein